MRIIKMNRGETIVDAIDYEFAKSLTLCLTNSGYALAWVKDRKRKMLLHRLIAERAGLDLSHHIDHINRNKLDNRRENLRSATVSQNKANSEKPITNTSGFKGVSWHKTHQKWQAGVKLNGKRYHLGYFNTPEEAYAVYQQKAAEFFGKFTPTEESHALHTNASSRGITVDGNTPGSLPGLLPESFQPRRMGAETFG